MRAVVADLLRRGVAAELREPGADDPLGGVIDVCGEFGLVLIINLADRFPAVIEDALRSATLAVRSCSRLCVVPVPHLVALKLYAGDPKSKADTRDVVYEMFHRFLARSEDDFGPRPSLKSAVSRRRHGNHSQDPSEIAPAIGA